MIDGGALILAPTIEGAGSSVPALAAAGARASMRFLEFFAANIRNRHTRRAHFRAAEEFLAWCSGAGVPSIAAVQPVHVAAWIEMSGHELAAPSVKQRLAALRHLFDWLVNGQVVVLLFGSGGVMVEVYNDVALRRCPITRSEAQAMTAELKGARLLHGFRGRLAADLEALADTLVRVSHLAMHLKGHLAELDINPLIVLPSGQGVKAVDALVVFRGT